MTKRELVIRFLREDNFSPLFDMAVNESGILRILISLTYDREDILSWRAMEAVGLIAARRALNDPGAVRGLVQRLLWMMRDESGNNPWSAPDMLGEIVRNCPDEFQDIAPIIVSFHDEEILRAGVLRAVVRIGEIRPDLAEAAAPIVGEYLKHSDPLTRHYALHIAGILGLKDLLPCIEPLVRDETGLKIYEDRNFKTIRLAKTAEETVIILRAQGK